MGMKITVEFLKEHKACIEGIEWFKNQKETDLVGLVEYSIKNKSKLSWANWLIVRKMTYKQYVSYAIYAAQQVLHIFEDKYSDDKRPRNAINAALKCLENRNKSTSAAAYATADAANAANAADAAYAAYDAADAAYDAANAANAADAADAAYDAAAYAAASAAYYAVADAADAANAADAADATAGDKLLIKILKYGIKLLK